jgi:hypothetical protein
VQEEEEEGSRMALMAVLERKRHEDKMCNQCEARAFMADGAVCVCVMGGMDQPTTPLASSRLSLGISFEYA